MGGDVKKDLYLASEIDLQTAGVRFQFREYAAGCADLSGGTTVDEGDDRGAR
jgi:hypothetical protein